MVHCVLPFSVAGSRKPCIYKGGTGVKVKIMKRNSIKKTILKTKVSDQTKSVVREVLIGCSMIPRRDLYSEATKILGIEKLNEIKHALWNMLKRNQVIKIDHEMICINPQCIYNDYYRENK